MTDPALIKSRAIVDIEWNTNHVRMARFRYISLYIGLITLSWLKLCDGKLAEISVEFIVID